MMTITFAALLSAVLLSTLAASAPIATVVRAYSHETGKWLSLAEEGRITVSNQPASLNFEYLSDDLDNRLVRIQVVKGGESCFVYYNADGTFAVGEPDVDNGNDVFEQVLANTIGSIQVHAIRAVNLHKLRAESVTESEGSAMGSGATEEETSDEDEATTTTATEEVEDCYFGIRNGASEPECFPSHEYAATRFSII